MQDPPAELRVQTIRDLLGDIIANLDLLLTDGVSVGLSDREYLRTLMDLRNIAISSKASENEGAYMRPYQYSMMMIVRWLTQFSLASAMHYETREGSDEFAIYQWAQQSIDEGVITSKTARLSASLICTAASPRPCVPSSVFIIAGTSWMSVNYLLAGDNDQPLPDLALPDVCLDGADNGGLEMLMPSSGLALSTVAMCRQRVGRCLNKTRSQFAERTTTHSESMSARLGYPITAFCVFEMAPSMPFQTARTNTSPRLSPKRVTI